MGMGHDEGTGKDESRLLICVIVIGEVAVSMKRDVQYGKRWLVGRWVSYIDHDLMLRS